jgi:hypothetical protein
MSMLEEQLRDYFAALHEVPRTGTDLTETGAAPGPRRRRLALLAVTAAAIVFAGVAVAVVVALRDDSDHATPTVSVPPATTVVPIPDSSGVTTTPTAEWPVLPTPDRRVECLPYTGLLQWVLWVAVWEGRDGCFLAADHQQLQVQNKGFARVTLLWDGVEHVLDADASYTTGPVGEVLEYGHKLVSVSPYPSISIDVVPPFQTSTWSWTFGMDGIGPFRLGDAFEEVTTSSALPFVYASGPGPSPVCRSVFVRDDPYAPFFVVAQRGDGTAEVTAVSVSAPSQIGPSGIHTGMTRAELEEATGHIWDATDIRTLSDDPDYEFIGWSDPASNTEIVAILESGVARQVVIRPISSPVRGLPFTTGCELLT